MVVLRGNAIGLARHQLWLHCQHDAARCHCGSAPRTAVRDVPPILTEVFSWLN